jgi:hypothetical protein
VVNSGEVFIYGRNVAWLNEKEKSRLGEEVRTSEMMVMVSSGDSPSFGDLSKKRQQTFSFKKRDHLQNLLLIVKRSNQHPIPGVLG